MTLTNAINKLRKNGWAVESSTTNPANIFVASKDSAKDSIFLYRNGDQNAVAVIEVRRKGFADGTFADSIPQALRLVSYLQSQDVR